MSKKAKKLENSEEANMSKKVDTKIENSQIKVLKEKWNFDQDRIDLLTTSKTADEFIKKCGLWFETERTKEFNSDITEYFKGK